MKNKVLISLTLITLILIISEIQTQLYQTTSNNLLSQTSICNATNFQFHDIANYPKGNQLNKTFTSVKKKIDSKSDQMSLKWIAPNNDTYDMYISYFNFSVISQNQTAKFVSPKFILVENGFVQVQIHITFLLNWFRSQGQFVRGNVIAKGISKQLPFSVIVDTYQTNPYYQLYQFTNLTFGDLSLSQFQYDNVSATDEQKTFINMLVSKGANNVTSLRQALQDQVNSYHNLQNQLKDAISQEFASTIHSLYYYVWVKQKKAFEVIFNRKTTGFRIDPNGTYFSYKFDIDNVDNQKCGPSPPTAPLNVKTYGGRQQFVSYTLLQNTLMNATQNGFLNSNLNLNNWSSRSFKFTAGQLVTVFSNISSTFGTTSQVVGTCNTTDIKKISVNKSSTSTFNVNFSSNCNLMIKNIKIVEFGIDIQLEVKGTVYSKYTDIWLKSFKFTTVYNDSFGFKLLSKTKADQMVKDSLDTLHDSRLFGSGWSLFLQRQDPIMIALQNSVMFYDSAVKMN